MSTEPRDNGWGKRVNATMAGRMMRSMMCRAIRWVIGPRFCVMWARVIGRVAVRIHVET